MDVSLQIQTATRQCVLPALELLFRSLSRDERAAQMATTISALRAGKLSTDGLFQAVRAGRLVGVVWASPNGGKTALMWTPVIIEGETTSTTAPLVAGDNPLMTAFRRANAMRAAWHASSKQLTKARSIARNSTVARQRLTCSPGIKRWAHLNLTCG